MMGKLEKFKLIQLIFYVNFKLINNKHNLQL